jgi:hypothetical protein
MKGTDQVGAVPVSNSNLQPLRTTQEGWGVGLLMRLTWLGLISFIVPLGT